MIPQVALGAIAAVIWPRRAVWILIAMTIAYPQYLLSPSEIVGRAELVHEESLIRPLAIQAGLGFGLAVSCLRYARGASLRLWAPVAVLAVSYLVVGVVRGAPIEAAVGEFLPLSGYVTIVAVPLLLARSEADLRRLLRAMLLLTTIACAGAVLEFALGIGVAQRYYEQARSAKGQVGAFIGWTIVAVAYLRPTLRAWLGIPPMVLGAAAAVLGVAAVLTVNRFMTVLYVLSAVAIAADAVRRGRLRPSIPFIVIGVGVTIASLGSVVEINPLLRGGISEVSFELDEHRAYEYTLPGQRIDDPYDIALGSGAGASWIRPTDGVTDYGNHNFYVQVVWKMGAAGILTIGVVVFVWRRDVRRIGRRTTPDLRAVVDVARAAVAGIVLMGVTQNRFMSGKHTALIGLLLAIPYVVGRVSNAAGSQLPDATAAGS